MHSLCALLLVLAPESAEQRFMNALRADLAAGKAEKTLPFIAPAAREQLGASRLTPVYKQWGGNGEIKSLRVDPTTPYGPSRRVRFLMEQERASTHVVCHLDGKERIVGYWFRVAPPKWSRERIETYTRTRSGDIAWAVGRPGRIDAYVKGSEDPYPLGSIFKLYVLAALAQEIDEGAISLDTVVTVREPLKSFPSGDTQHDRDGTKRKVSDLAAKMISISDNTATDLLIGLVGRGTIERGLVKWHNSVPQANTPFLTTREMFLIKGGGKEAALNRNFLELCRDYPKQSVETRRSWVRTLTEPFAKSTFEELMRTIPAGYGLRTAGGPAHLTFEWFAQPEDICALNLAMWERKRPGAEHYLKYYAMGSELYPREWVNYFG
ncbi:MAG: serine hydrolase, partial [Planctomycetota bacterium]